MVTSTCEIEEGKGTQSVFIIKFMLHGAIPRHAEARAAITSSLCMFCKPAHLNTGLDGDGGDLLDHISGGVQVDQALVDPARETNGASGSWMPDAVTKDVPAVKGPITVSAPALRLASPLHPPPVSPASGPHSPHLISNLSKVEVP